jgi:hypothetical protein
MRTAIRLGTVIAIIALCGFAVASGWSIVHFSLAMRGIDASKKAAEARGWTSVPGLASTARQVELMETIDPSDLTAANERRETISAFLSVRPLSSYHWVMLSSMEFATAQRMDDVLDALTLSVLTGPNEGYVMSERGIFGVSVWEDLPPDLKKRTALDLAPIMFPRTPAEGAEGGRLLTVLATTSESARSELRNALLATGIAAKDIKRLGL